MNPEAMADVHTQGAFSMVELLLAADPVVKAVLISLVIASVWSWAVVTFNNCRSLVIGMPVNFPP